MAKTKLKLDKEINERLDAIVEDDVRKGWKVVTLPEAYQEALKAEEIEPPVALRFLRMNPARKRKVAELVQRQYFKDMQDDNLLSEMQVRALAAKRGEWTEDHEKQLAEASEKSQALMSRLYSAGFASGSEKWLETITNHAQTVREALEGKEELLAVFDRWLEYKVSNRPAYTELYAAAQGLSQYSPDRDYMSLTSEGAAVAALVDELDELKGRVEDYFSLIEIRTKQAELQVRRDRIFDQTAESRRDTAEELARLYVTSTVCGPNGEDLGPITPTFDQLWNYPFDVLQYLTSEAYLFHNGIPDEAREYLEVFGFLASKQPSGASTPSDESPVEVTSSSASLPAATTPAATSE